MCNHQMVNLIIRMHNYIIEAMVEALKPVLKNPAKAKQILDRFWSDKMALVWDVRDVPRQPMNGNLH